MKSTALDLILASSSPRRQDYFRALGLDFRAVTADIDETPLSDELPDAMVKRLAVEKAAAVAARLGPQKNAETRIIVAADTTVALDGAILGKPVDAEEAWAMLARLRGREHQVYSAVAMLCTKGDAEPNTEPDEPRVRVNPTVVTMRPYTDAEIADYVASGDPLDKAGAYALQHPEFAPAATLSGCVASVVGLPLNDLVTLLAEAGVDVGCELAPICEAKVAFGCCTRTLVADAP